MISEPYKAKIIQFPKKTTYSDRLMIAKKYSYNVNLIPSEYFIVDAGRKDANALSELQYSALFKGDEAYAGSRNFLKISSKVRQIFGKGFTLPTHNERGAEHLLFKAIIEEEGKVRTYGRTRSFEVLMKHFKVDEAEDANVVYIYRTDPNELESVLEANEGKLRIVNASLIFSSFVFAKLEGKVSGSLGEFLRRISENSEVILISAVDDLFSHVGALLITDDEEIYRKFQSWVVSFEGLHTYGGLSGRDMEVIAEGLDEALREDYWEWRYKEISYLYSRIKDMGYEVEPSFHSSGFSIAHSNPFGFNLAMFLSASCRIHARNGKIDVSLPKRVYTKEHLEFLAEAFAYLKDKELPILTPRFFVKYNESEALEFDVSRLERYDEIEYEGFPYRFKGVELLTSRTREYRERAIEEAGYNTFLLRSEDVYIDLLTDSGTSAQSDEQWSRGIYYDFRDAYDYLKQAVKEILGYELFVPTHQGRQAEYLISQALIEPGQYVINNMYFTTTRFHQEYAGGIFVDLIVDEAHDPSSEYPFKGNIDVDKLERFIQEKGAQNIAYVVIETNVNMAGGQPVSLQNIKLVRKICDRYGIPLIFDATRIAENAYFIKQREEAYKDKSIAWIIKEILSYGDGASISAKKDPLTNISGLLLVRDEKIYRKVKDFITGFDGSPYSGGLADRDLAMLAQGIYEMTNYDYIRTRIEQVHYLGRKLDENGIPLVKPFGGHAIYLDAKKFLPHIPQDEFPAQVLASEIYIEGGVRTMERGTVSAGRDPQTGENRKPKLELVRITIPRRVYTNTHMDQVVEAILGVWRRRNELKGLEFVYEAPFLRFFTSRFRRKV